MSTIALTHADRQVVARSFADVLSYPYASPIAVAGASADLVRERSDEAATLLEAFASLVDSAGLGTLQEEYTRAFDLDTMSKTEPTCYPYVGHYLFDESHKRGAFILGLKKRYRATGFEDDSDLPDHLVVLLRFLTVCEDDELAEELVDDAILPALARMAVAAGRPPTEEVSIRGAYIGVLRALELTLSDGRPERVVDPLDREAEREWLRDRDSLGIDRQRCGH